MRKTDPELHQRRREEILAAAISCFIRRGFHLSSMQDIAVASGVSMGLLYRYFTNKEAIIEAAAVRERAEAVDVIEKLPDTGVAAELWCEALIAMAEVASEPDHMRLTNEIVAEAGRTPKLMAMLRDYDLAIASAIAQKLSTQQMADTVPSIVDPAAAAQTMLVLLEGLTARNMVMGAQFGLTHRQLLKQLVEAALK